MRKRNQHFLRGITYASEKPILVLWIRHLFWRGRVGFQGEKKKEQDFTKKEERGERKKEVRDGREEPVREKRGEGSQQEVEE